MAETKHESLLERDLRAVLDRRGWEVLAEQRHGVNLDLSVRVNGIPGRVSIRAAFLPPRGLLKHTYQPTYLRVVLGRPGGEPARWAVWDHTWFPRGSKHSPASCARVVHEAMGDGWAALAACSVSPKQTWWERSATIDTLLARAEKLAPGQDEGARRAQIFRVQRRYFERQMQRGREIALVAVLGVLAVGAAAGLVAGLTADTPPDTRESDFLIARVFIAVVCGIMVVAFYAAGNNASTDAWGGAGRRSSRAPFDGDGGDLGGRQAQAPRGRAGRACDRSIRPGRAPGRRATLFACPGDRRPLPVMLTYSIGRVGLPSSIRWPLWTREVSSPAPTNTWALVTCSARMPLSTDRMIASRPAESTRCSVTPGVATPRGAQKVQRSRAPAPAGSRATPARASPRSRSPR